MVAAGCGLRLVAVVAVGRKLRCTCSFVSGFLAPLQVLVYMRTYSICYSYSYSIHIVRCASDVRAWLLRSHCVWII